MRRKSIKVTHFQRKPTLGAYSLDRLFDDIRAAMPGDIKVEARESSFISRGLWRRVYNIVEAVFRQGDVNHITGDVHFLTYLLKRQRTVLTIHDCVSLERLSGIKRWILWLFWYRLPVRRSGAITVISEATMRELLKVVNCAPEKIQVIYDCVSECFCPEEQPFTSSCPRILHVGTTKNKNIDRVAEALADINCRWVIVGRLSSAQRTMIESYDIDYENHVGLSDETLLEQYKLADMLVFASTYEGFGLPIVEANAVGRPVVSSALYSMPEVAGDAACLVDPYDVGSIRAGILRVIEDADYRDRLVKAGFGNVERFRPAVIAGQYAQLYRKMSGMSKLE
jgi:glycosyltransferase involved in cell wall biosynthesis